MKKGVTMSMVVSSSKALRRGMGKRGADKSQSQKDEFGSPARILKGMRFFLTGTDDGVFVTDISGRVVFMNKAGHRLMGVSPGKIKNRFCYETFRGIDGGGEAVCAEECFIRRRMVRRKTNRGLTVSWLRGNGRRQWFDVSVLSSWESGLTVHVFRPHVKGSAADEREESMGGARILRSRYPSRDVLPPREKEILVLVAHCVETDDIAYRLSISIVTVRNHIQNTLHKLHAGSRLEAVMTGIREGLIEV